MKPDFSWLLWDCWSSQGRHLCSGRKGEKGHLWRVQAEREIGSPRIGKKSENCRILECWRSVTGFLLAPREIIGPHPPGDGVGMTTGYVERSWTQHGHHACWHTGEHGGPWRCSSLRSWTQTPIFSAEQRFPCLLWSNYPRGNSQKFALCETPGHFQDPTWEIGNLVNFLPEASWRPEVRHHLI